MAYRLSCLRFLASFLAAIVFVLGAAVLPALAKKPDSPHNTQLPNGRPFQLIQKMIDDLDARIDALEATKTGTMWINPLDFTATGGTVGLAAAAAAAPGLLVSGVATSDTLQAGLQVPLGFAIKGATVCYAPGTSGFVASVALAKNILTTTPFGSASLGTTDPILTSPGAETCVALTLATAYDPSDGTTGGPAYLAIGLSFPGLVADQVAIRAIGIVLESVTGP